MKTQVCLAALCTIMGSASALAQGSLTPPGAPASTMKSLAQIEPRTPISSTPYTISNSGSYYLTTNLTGVSGSAAIKITASDVTVDLKGFSLVGIPGSDEGFVLSGAVTNVAVFNGTIRNFGYYGISGSTGDSCTFQNLRVLNNANVGIFTGVAATVKDCVIEGNATYGVIVGESSLVTGCSVRTNANGVGLGNGSVAIGCSSMYNNGYGIYADSSVTIQNCSVRGNGSLGIAVADGCTVTACSSSLNGSYGVWVANGAGAGGSRISGCSVTENLADGINVPAYGNTIVGNTCSYNGATGATNSAGIRVDGSGNRIENNNLVANQNRGLRVTSAGNFIVQNTASGNTVAYDIAGTQTIGPIVSTTGTISTTNSPWANFSY